MSTNNCNYCGITYTEYREHINNCPFFISQVSNLKGGMDDPYKRSDPFGFLKRDIDLVETDDEDEDAKREEVEYMPVTITQSPEQEVIPRRKPKQRKKTMLDIAYADDDDGGEVLEWDTDEVDDDAEVEIDSDGDVDIELDDEQEEDVLDLEQHIPPLPAFDLLFPPEEQKRVHERDRGVVKPDKLEIDSDEETLPPQEDEIQEIDDEEMNDIFEDNDIDLIAEEIEAEEEEEIEREEDVLTQPPPEEEKDEFEEMGVYYINTGNNARNINNINRYVAERVGFHNDTPIVWGTLDFTDKNRYIRLILELVSRKAAGFDNTLVQFGLINNIHDLNNVNPAETYHNYRPNRIHLLKAALITLAEGGDRPEVRGSDETFGDNLINAVGMIIQFITKGAAGNGRIRQNGANWGTLLKWDYDLSVLGIYNIHQRDEYKIEKPCLLIAIDAQLKDFVKDNKLEQKDYETKIATLKSLLNGITVRKDSLSKVANYIEIKINLKYLVNNGKDKFGNIKKRKVKQLYKPKLKEDQEDEFLTVQIGLLDDHFFRNDLDFGITTFAIENWNKIKDIDRWYYIFKYDSKRSPPYRRDLQRTMCGFDLFRKILKHPETLFEEYNHNNIDVDPEEIVYIEDLDTANKPTVKNPGKKIWANKNHTMKTKNINSLVLFQGDLKKDNQIESVIEHFALSKLIKKGTDEQLKNKLDIIQQKRLIENNNNTNSNTVAMKTIEFQDINKLKTLLKIPNIFKKLADLKFKDLNKEKLHTKTYDEVLKSIKNALKKLAKNIDDKGFQIVEYKYQDCGRKNSIQMGIQLESRLFRGLLCREYYVDVDMVNAHYVIAEFVYRTKYKLDTVKMQNYINWRENYYEDILGLNKDTDLTRGKLKSIYLIILNGGVRDINKFLDTYEVPDDFNDFIEYMNETHAKILAKDKKKLQDYKIDFPYKKNHNLSYLSSLLTPIENELLDFAVKKFIEWGIIKHYLYTNIYDGFQFFKWIDITDDKINKAIKKLNKEIQKEKGIDIEFKRKTIENIVTMSDLATVNEWKEMGFECGGYIEEIPYSDAMAVVQDNIKTYVNKINIENKYHVCFFDFETDTKANIRNEHKPYCVGYCIDNEPIKFIWGTDCAKQLLEVIPSFTLMIAHNLNYDYRFLAAIPEVRFDTKCQYVYFNNRYMCGAIEYKGKQIQLKDSFTLIPTALAKFPKMFNLQNIKKEAYPYELFKINTMNNINNYKIEDALKYLSESNKKIFLDNITSLNLKYNNGTFNHKKYAEFYCCQDVRILRDGYNTFRKQILEFTKNQFIPLDVDRICSSSSIAERYVFNEQVYEGTVTLKNITRDFIQQSIQGGCTRSYKNYMLRTEGNKVYARTSEKVFQLYKQKNPIEIVDFDACSLYPSAMYEMGCIPTGKPVIAKGYKLDWDWLKNNTSACFMRIKITKVNKSRANPIMSVKIDGKAYFEDRLWINREVYVSNIKLQDLIDFHDIEFKLKRAIYFKKNEVNNKLGEVIKGLYDLRLEYKKVKNPLQNVIKLIMNSVYGKTSLKPQKYRTEFINSQKEYLDFIGKKYNLVRESYRVKGTEKYLVKILNDIDEDSNMCYIGSLILDMSKRIMNRVICLAEDLNILVMYQDTDSIHINFKDLDTLSKKYKELYNKELVGIYMGQFHSDFTVPSHLKDKADPNYEPRSIKTIIVGRKVYYDKVQINKEGDTFEHMRMKGVSESAVIKYCEDNNITLEQLYEKLFNNEEIEFDLAQTRPIFKMKNTLTIETVPVFKRKVSFNVKNTDHLFLGNYDDEIEDEFIHQYITRSASPFVNTNPNKMKTIKIFDYQAN